MIKPAVLDAMVAAGCTAEQIAAAVKADQAGSSGAERQARYRARKASQSDERNVTSVTVTDSPSPKESPPTPPKEITPSPEPNGSLGVGKARANDLSEFKTELSDLDAERLEAIVKHRRSKRGQLTGLSARLFRSDAAACGLSLPEAVDTCISRNWITVKPEFLAGRSAPPRQSTSPPFRERTVSDALGEMAAGTWKPPGHDHEPDFPTIETCFHRRN